MPVVACPSPSPTRSSQDMPQAFTSPHSTAGSFEHVGSDTKRGSPQVIIHRSSASVMSSTISPEESRVSSPTPALAIIQVNESGTPQHRDSPPGGPDYRSIGMMPVTLPTRYTPTTMTSSSPARGRPTVVKPAAQFSRGYAPSQPMVQVIIPSQDSSRASSPEETTLVPVTVAPPLGYWGCGPMVSSPSPIHTSETPVQIPPTPEFVSRLRIGNETRFPPTEGPTQLVAPVARSERTNTTTPSSIASSTTSSSTRTSTRNSVVLPDPPMQPRVCLPPQGPNHAGMHQGHLNHTRPIEPRDEEWTTPGQQPQQGFSFSPFVPPSQRRPVPGDGRASPSIYVHVQSEYNYGQGFAFFKASLQGVRYIAIPRYHWNGEIMGPQENGEYAINEISQYDLELLLSILQPSNMVNPYGHIQGSSQWIGILKVSCHIGLGKAKALAIAKIEELDEIFAVERYSLGSQHQIPSWKEKGLKQLCTRSPEERFSREEGRILGVDAVLEIQEIQLEFQAKMKAVLENLTHMNF